MTFHDRTDAGKHLAEALKEYQGRKDVLVLALPRGGVVVGAEIARALNVPLDIVVPRKIGAPGNEEFAIGALTEDGSAVLNEDIIASYGIPQSSIDATIAREKQEAERRLKTYRGTRPPLDCAGKTVILVDDGIATGYTMRAAIQSVRHKGAQSVIVAIPVAANDALEMIRKEVDDVVCLTTPEFFSAVGQFYEHFNQTTDQEVIDFLNF